MMDYYNPNDHWRAGMPDSMNGLSDDERMKAGCLQMAAFVLLLLGALVLCALLGSCTTTKYVEVARVKTDTVRVNRTERDSIYVRDSIWVNQTQRGDTVWVEKTRWKTVWQNHTAHDTVYRSRTDSVPVPYPVTEYMERELTWWQQARLHLANIMLFALAIVAGVWIWRKTRP